MDGTGRQTGLADQLARAGIISHLLRADPADAAAVEEVEQAALQALCDVSPGPVFRIGDLEYGFSADAADDEALSALAGRLALAIFGDGPGDITLTPVTPADDAPALDRMAVMLLDRLGETALRAAGPETLAAIDAGYAVAAATLAAEEIGALVDRVGERVRAIIPPPSALPAPREAPRDTVALDALSAEIAAIRGRLEADPVAERLEAVLARLPDPGAPPLAGLEARLDGIEARLGQRPDPEAFVERLEAALGPLADRLAALEKRLDSLSAAPAARDGLEARLSAIEELLQRIPVCGGEAGVGEGALVRRLSPILDQLDMIARRVEALPPPDLAPVLTSVEGLAGRLPPPVDLTPLREGLGALAERIDSLADRPAPATADQVALLANDLARLRAAVDAAGDRLSDLAERPTAATDLGPVLDGIAALEGTISAERASYPGPETLTVLAASLRTVLRRLDQEADALATLRESLSLTGAAQSGGLVLALEPGADVEAALAVSARTPMTESLGLALLDRLSRIEAMLGLRGAADPSPDDAVPDTAPDAGEAAA